jgi:hypothetical protein
MQAQAQGEPADAGADDHNVHGILRCAAGKLAEGPIPVMPRGGGASNRIDPRGYWIARFRGR